ncbi:hypothetical protein [Sphingomonas sp.]|jgi:hypothetical protein|uniref:hypothetical protein n=1 Tax=Sphingomonas sp. TaxID=28214 RepID=UPI002ED77C4C
MMLLALLLQSVALSPPGPIPGVLPKQALPSKGCAAYLWSVADRSLVAMASADPGQLRMTIDGRIVDVGQAAARGAGDYGFAAVTDYAGGDLSATLDMTVARRPDLAAGAAVPSGTLTIARAGHDVVVVPVAGVIGCV